MKLTIRQIAEMAGVSITTVSQILNNKGSRFSEKTRKRVLDIVNEYQYKPDFFASNLINRHSKTIGMIVPEVTDLFFTKIVEGAESYLDPLGYMLVLCHSQQDPDKEIKFLEELAHRSVDGVLLATPNLIPENIRKNNRYRDRMSMILIDRGINRRDHGRIIIKEYEACYQTIVYLSQQGHQKIGMLQEQTGYYQLEERLNGYKDALKDLNIPFHKNRTVAGELTVRGGYLATKQLLAQDDEITAIFCANDAMAMGCYQALYELGKKVPEDISVVGFDGMSLTESMVPPLTTIAQPIFDIGYTAAKFLVDAIEYPEREIPNKVFNTKLIIRESVRPLTKE